MISKDNTCTPYVTLFLLALIAIVEGLDNPYRSVEKCENESRIVPQLWVPVNCRLHCEKKYLFTSFETNRVNKRIFQYRVNILDRGKSFECCCKFNWPWPQFVHPSAVDRVHNQPQKMTKPYDCMPLGPIKIGISDRTSDAYNRVCEYLEKKEPLSMLEVLDFANMTSYLNMMQPKNPMILRTIAHKSMKIVTKNVFISLNETIQDREKTFLGSFKPLNEFEGYKLTAQTVRNIANLIKYHLADAMKNKVISKAIDEYVLSHVVVDIKAAAMKANELNLDLNIPEHLLRSEYDQYNKENERQAFLIDSGELNCKTLEQTQRRVNIYLLSIQTTLSSLSRKLAYEHLGEVNPDMKYLLQAQKVYSLLEKVNCQRTPSRAPARSG